MQTLDFFQNTRIPAAIALGFFDCIHVGHRAIINVVNREAKAHGVKSCLFTFRNNPARTMGRDSKLIYDFSQRVELLKECGLDAVVAAPFDEAFRRTKMLEFLKNLSSSFDLRALVCGGDYRFGEGGEGDAAYLSGYCRENGIPFFKVPDVKIDGIKASSTLIKRLLTDGDIETANRFLGAEYRMDGVVVHGRGVGTQNGVPTANIEPSTDIVLPKFGVYGTTVELDGKIYRSVTNVGTKPTYGVETVTIETLILDCKKMLYGENITVKFYKYLRGIQRFSDPQALRGQIACDSEWQI